MCSDTTQKWHNTMYRVPWVIFICKVPVLITAFVVHGSLYDSIVCESGKGTTMMI